MSDTPTEDPKAVFISHMVEYVQTHNNFDELDKPGAIQATLEVLLSDVGAAQDYINALGLNINLYADMFGDGPNDLHQDLRAVLNKHSVERHSDTPDSVLATYLVDCLKTWSNNVRRRDRFWDISPGIPELELEAPDGSGGTGPADAGSSDEGGGG